jgi:hypothetical protein
MKKSLFIFGLLFIYLLGVGYFLLPSPQINDLPESLKSNEPGDTWQNTDTKAFFTDWDREKVIGYYRDTFRLKIGNFYLPNLRLNYRPEDTGTYVRKYIDTYYLEEIVIPMRESVFINGWDPKKSPSLAHLSEEEKKTTFIVIDGREFQAKVTLKWYKSDVFYRLLVWTLTIIVIPFLLLNFGRSIKTFFDAMFSLFLKRK